MKEVIPKLIDLVEWTYPWLVVKIIKETLFNGLVGIMGNLNIHVKKSVTKKTPFSAKNDPKPIYCSKTTQATEFSV